MRFFVFVILSLFITTSLTGQNTSSITGKVIDKSTLLPLEFVNVQIENLGLGAVTDSTGYFLVSNIPVGSYNITISYLGYQTIKLYNVVITSGNENTYSIELESSVSTLQEVVVKGTNRTVKAVSIETPLSVQRITTEEIRSNPGGNFDISKVIQALPGVGGGAGGGTFRNDIIIRGGAPNENVFYVDGIEVPVINHFQTQGSSGGPQGMLNVSFIEDVKLTTSAFDARYDDAVSSVFQFKQKNGNPNHIQGNLRLSATEFATTFEGPLSSTKNTTFLASARRSYLQLLFKALDLPIRPNYWDFQAKVSHQIDKKTSITFLGIAAIDEFSFAPTRNSTPENTYTINSSPLINQWNYTVGLSLKRSIKNGSANLALSRTHFDNKIKKYEDNQQPSDANKTLDIASATIENKLRLDINKSMNGWKLAYGASFQAIDFNNKTFALVQKQIADDNGQQVQPKIDFNFVSPLPLVWKYGGFVQVGKRIFNEKLGLSAGMRTDMNSFTITGGNPLKTMSPRLSASYAISDKWNINASTGQYFKLAPYTILGYADNQNKLVNNNVDYLKSNHLVGGIEYIPSEDIRFTLEAFNKKYHNVPVSLRNGIALSNLGADFNIVGNEAVISNGKGRAYGVEFFAQKKLTDRFFGVFSYTWYRSEYAGTNGLFLPSTWDNRQLISTTLGYKLPRNWELGIKFRFQGGAPYTPFDEEKSRLNYISQGTGTLDYSKINSLRLGAFNSADIRIDKKWNFKKTSFDFFIDITNFYMARNPAYPEYTFERTADNSGFKTTDGKPISPNGKNAVPTRIINDDPFFAPSIGLIWEF